MKRDWIIILGVCVAAIVIGGGFFLISSGASSVGPGQEMGKVVLAEGDTAQMTDRKNYRINNQDEYVSIWSLAYGPEATEPPFVDFATQEVLAVFDGQRPTGGYAIEVTNVSDGSGKRNVSITHLLPGENCVVTDALTSPFQIVAVPASSREINRIDIDSVVACN